MKKKILRICLFIIIGALLIFGGTRLYRHIAKQAQPPVSMMIASDMHYLSPDYRGEYFKEPSAMFDGKLTHYSSEYFDAFLAEVMEKQPEILILSGDLTLNGSKKSHEEVVAKLEKIQEAGIQVLVIPGNHDLNSAAGDYSPETPVLVENTDSAAFLQMYENFGPAQALSRDTDTFSYVYEVSPFLRILMLDSNSITKGLIEDSTLAWMENELKAAKFAGADVIAVTHQNLHIHNPILYFSYQLYNADELLALYEKYDVKLNLSGHIHIQSIVSDVTTPDITVPEVAVGSLAVCGTPYGEITYDGKQISYSTVKTDVSAYAIANGWTDENLLDFNNYSTWYFEEVGRLQNYASFEESNLTSEEVTLLANTFAQINSAYFVGDNIDVDGLSEGITLWRTQKEDFTLRYIETMLETADENNQSLTVELN